MRDGHGTGKRERQKMRARLAAVCAPWDLRLRTRGAARSTRSCGASRPAVSRRTAWSALSQAARSPREPSATSCGRATTRPCHAIGWFARMGSLRSRGTAPGSVVRVWIRRGPGRHRELPVDAAVPRARPDVRPCRGLLTKPVGEDGIDVDGLRDPTVLQQEVAKRGPCARGHRADAIRSGESFCAASISVSEHVALMRRVFEVAYFITTSTAASPDPRSHRPAREAPLEGSA